MGGLGSATPRLFVYRTLTFKIVGDPSVLVCCRLVCSKVAREMVSCSSITLLNGMTDILMSPCKCVAKSACGGFTICMLELQCHPEKE